MNKIWIKNDNSSLLAYSFINAFDFVDEQSHTTGNLRIITDAIEVDKGTPYVFCAL